MGLRETAETDMTFILNDVNGGFGYPVTVTNPDGVSAPLNGLSTDIHQAIDPDTGTIISGRSASVSLSISDLANVGLVLPVGVSDSKSKPWLISFDDVNSNSYLFKVSQTMPDRGIGLIVCILELYSNG